MVLSLYVEESARWTDPVRVLACMNAAQLNVRDKWAKILILSFIPVKRVIKMVSNGFIKDSPRYPLPTFYTTA